MTIDFVPDQHSESRPRITVFGVGGAGGNAVNNMINGQLDGVEFVVANTDSQSLYQSLCDHRVQLGVNITHGLGAGARPDIGKVAAEEALDDVQRYLDSNNMVFIAAGMGGGTGTGAAPVIARAAREQGILTVGVVTKPFQFEGIQRMRIAELGIQELQQYVDTLIVIPNQNLFRIANEQTTFASAFKMADDVLHAGVRGVTDLMVNPGLINLDFADIRTVMSEMGKAMMGTGEGETETRATEAAEAAINNPLLDNASIEGARGVLINITGGTDMTLHEVDEAASRICKEVDSDANIIFGTSLDPELEGRMRVAVIATGIDADEVRAPLPEHSDKVHVLGFSERKSAQGASAAPSTAAATPETQPVAERQAPERAAAQSAAPDPEPIAKPMFDEPEAIIELETEYLPEAPAADETQPPQATEATAAPMIEAEEQPHKTVSASTSGGVAAGVALSPPIQSTERRTPAPTAPTVQPNPLTRRGEPLIERSKGLQPMPMADESQPARAAMSPQPERARQPATGAGPGPRDEAQTGRRPTLFERMTGTGRARRDEPAKPAAGSRPIRNDAPLSRPMHAPPSSDGPSLDPLATRAGGTPEDDPLEIPAFLRRQAN